MENIALTRITEFLKAHGTSVDAISKSRLAQFEKVDRAIQARLEEVKKAQDLLRGNPINISTIATDTDIARKTFYNNELLRLFVEEYSDINPEESSAEAEAARLRERCEELERQVQHFLMRDIHTENLRHENMQLQAEIQNMERRIKGLEEQYEASQSEVSRLQKIAPKAQILSFPQK